MSFDQFNLDRATEQSRGIFNEYVYQTDDTCSEVRAAGYFLRSRFATIDGPESESDGWVGGTVLCKCSDGYMYGEMDVTGTLNAIDEVAMYRASWKTAGATQTQLLAATDTPQVITFSDETMTSPFIVSDLGNGTFQSLIEANVKASFSFEVTRQSSGGIATWGFFLETETAPSVWTAIPDTLRTVKLKAVELNDVEHVQFDVATAVNAGGKFRIMQITDDHTDNVGLITEKPFTNAPVSAGAILSLELML